jgi:hypothetical protein
MGDTLTDFRTWFMVEKVGRVCVSDGIAGLADSCAGLRSLEEVGVRALYRLVL